VSAEGEANAPAGLRDLQEALRSDLGGLQSSGYVNPTASRQSEVAAGVVPLRTHRCARMTPDRDCSPAPPPRSSGAAPRVAIVGGGPGGLFTAYELQRLADRPLEVTLYEASDRLGGKVQSMRFRSADVRYEAGAAEIYDYSHFGHDPLRELVAELGLPVRAMGGSAMIADGAVIANTDDVRHHMGAHAHASLLAFDRLARDRMTPHEFYASGDDDQAIAGITAAAFGTVLGTVDSASARRYVEHLIHSDLATEPARTNEAYGLQNYLMNDPSYMRLYGIEGGNQRLVDEVAARLACTVRVGHRVESVGASPSGGFVLRHSSATGHAQDRHDLVVVALPHDQLHKVTFGGDRLREAAERHRAHHDHPAHYLRATVLFDRPFWKESMEESFWMLDRFDGCCMYDESSRNPLATHGILGWLIGGDAARTLAMDTDDEIVRAVLDSLPAFLSAQLSAGSARMIEARVHRWTGAVSALPGGWAPIPIERRHCPDPDGHPGLFMVGDYLYDSTLNGVLDSAERVAGWIAADLAEGRLPRRHAERSARDA
jgi:protoporphyrinogen oxidase